MRALLNSLGLTLWSSIAIVLAAGLALVGYRVSLIIRDSPVAIRSPTAHAGVQVAPAISHGSAPRPSTSAAPPARPAHGQMISHIIGPEMRAAQAALQTGQWQAALGNLQAAEVHQGITVFDKFTIHNLKGYAEVKLNKLKEAEADWEAALASGLYAPEEKAQRIRALFRIAAQNQQYPKAIEYGKQVADSPGVTPDDLSVMAQI
jgi:hypothetical protein